MQIFSGSQSVHVRTVMATNPGWRKCVQFTLDMNFDSDVAKEAFSDKLRVVRSLLTPRGVQYLDNRELLLALFDCVQTAAKEKND